MNFQIIGSGTAISEPARGPAGFLIEVDDARVLVDGGSGTVRRLCELGVRPGALDAGVYSHRHMDHCGDLGPLLFAMYVERLRTRDYPLFAGEGFREFLASLQSLYGRSLGGRGWAVPVTELPLDGPGAAALPGGLRLETRPANHSGGALHLKFIAPSGASAVFSGDTGPSEGLIELARGADLLVCECAFREEIPGVGHLWPEALAEIVAASQPGQVLVTHLYPDVDPEQVLRVVRRAGSPTELARDGQVVSL